MNHSKSRHDLLVFLLAFDAWALRRSGQRTEAEKAEGSRVQDPGPLLRR